MSGCPFHLTDAQAELSAEFDAFTFLADPHPFLRRAREHAPVFYDEVTGHWVVTRYEKYRAEWRLDGHVLCFDRTPLGCFVEIEGDDSPTVARRLGFDPSSAEPRSYLGIWADYKRENPDGPAEMVFP